MQRINIKPFYVLSIRLSNQRGLIVLNERSEIILMANEYLFALGAPLIR
jgi:hypothetical protein